MVIRDAKAIKLGSNTVNKIYYGTSKVYDTNKTVLEGYCTQNGEPTPDVPIPIQIMNGRQTYTIKNVDYIVDLKSKNLFSIDNLGLQSANSTLTKIDNNNFSYYGNANARFLIVLIGKVNDLIGKTLTANINYQSSANITGTNTAFITCDENGENRTNVQRLTFTENTINGSATITNDLDNTKYIGIRLYACSGVYPNTVNYSNVQIEIRFYRYHI